MHDFIEVGQKVLKRLSIHVQCTTAGGLRH